MRKLSVTRLILLLVSFIMGIIYGPSVKHSIPPMSLGGIIVILFGVMIGLQVVIGMLYNNSYIDKVWSKPSWTCNPFNWKQPLQFFHFGAYFTLVYGISSLVMYLLQGRGFILEAIIPLAMGIGLLLGVHFSVLIFKKKFNGHHG